MTVPYPDYPGYPPYPGYPVPQPRGTNGMAIASLVCAFVFAPLGIVFGHLSLSQIKRSGEDGRGLAIAGLVLSYLFTVVVIVAIVAGFLLVSWAERYAANERHYGRLGIPGVGPTEPIVVDGALPPFEPPAGLGSACAYPATPTAAVKPAKPPRSGAVPTTPGTVSATMTVDGGAVGLDLNNATSPCTVNSFVSLAQQGYFDDTPCHRLTDAPALAVLQCGDPTGSGAGGPGYRFDNEYPTNQYRPFDPALRQPVTYPRGTVAMANSGPNSNGSQFFIVYRDSLLPPTYTVFGTVDETGMATVDRLVSVGVDGGDDGKPQRPIVIESIRLN